MIMLFSFLLVMKYFANTMIAGEETYEQDCLRVHLEKQMYRFSLDLCLCVYTSDISWLKMQFKRGYCACYHD